MIVLIILLANNYLSLVCNYVYMKPIVIIGAGIAGLTAGYYISEKNPVIILEKNKVIGGRAGVEVFDNHLLDSGSQFIFSDFYNTKSLCKDLNLHNNFVHLNIKNFHLFKNKKMQPLDFLSMFNFFSFKEKIQIVKLFFEIIKFKSNLNYTNVKSVPELDSQFFSNWFVRKFDSSIFESFVQPIVSSLSLTHPEKISAAYGLSLLSSPLFGKVYGFKGGIGTISKSLFKSIVNNGGKIYLSEKAIKIKYSGKNILGVYTNKRFISTNNIISSIPVPEFLGVMDFNDKIKNKLKKISYSPCIYVLIAIDGKLFKKKFALMMPRIEWQDHLAVLDSSFKSSSHVPVNRTMLEVFIYEDHAKKLLNKNNKTISGKTINDLEKILNIKFTSNVKWSKVYKIRYALPIHTKNYGELISFFYNSGFRNLSFCGDYMAMPSLETAVWSGKEVAKNF